MLKCSVSGRLQPLHPIVELADELLLLDDDDCEEDDSELLDLQHVHHQFSAGQRGSLRVTRREKPCSGSTIFGDALSGSQNPMTQLVSATTMLQTYPFAELGSLSVSRL